MNRVSICLGILVAIGGIGTSDAKVVQNPEMTVVNLGTECPSWCWAQPASGTGEYDAQGVYTLTGNGHGVYWCWDRATFAFITGEVLNGSFQLTARIKEIPATGPGLVGLTLKAEPNTKSPVLDLRWDYYWQNNGGNGLTWFNRIVDPSKIGLHDQGEKGCNMVNGQGCMGQSYENRVPGFESRDDLWLRVKRVKDGTTSRYFLYAKYGTAEWTSVESKSGTNNPCGGTVTSVTLPNFLLPYTKDDLVYAGFTVGAGTYGAGSTTAKFDNVVLETDVAATVQETAVFYPNARPYRATVARDGITVAVPRSRPALQSAALIDMKGSIAPLSIVSGHQSGDIVLKGSQNISRGLYVLSLKTSSGTISLPLATSR